MKYETSPDFARAQDESDPLASFRDAFELPRSSSGELAIYLCGNSLGLMPKAARNLLEEELDKWAALGVEGHVSEPRPWLSYHELAAEKSACLVGASPLEVVTMNTLTVNLHFMMVSFYRPTRKRHKILLEAGAFPSDRYGVASQVAFHGFDPEEALIEMRPRTGESCLRTEDIERCLEQEGASVALVLLPGVQYATGQVMDMRLVAQTARKQGCTVGFDLAHAVGNVPLELHDWNADFAVWCNYKYMNGGPGAVAGAFVHERHARGFTGPRFAGWWGHDKASRFQMGPDFAAIEGAEGWQVSNPPVFSITPLLASLDIFDDAGMTALRTKSVLLTGYLEFLLRSELTERVEVLTPSDPDARGCQLSIRVVEGRATGRRAFEALLDRGVVLDWREPDILRVAPTPLYNRFEEVRRFVTILQETLRR